mgnify:CR=1 FL=1
MVLSEENDAETWVRGAVDLVDHGVCVFEGCLMTIVRAQANWSVMQSLAFSSAKTL